MLGDSTHLMDFCRAEGFGYSAAKRKVVRNSTGKAPNWKNTYATYAATCTDAAHFLPMADFEKTILQLLQTEEGLDDSPDPIFETVYEVEDLIAQAMDLHEVQFSPKGDSILRVGTGDAVKLDELMDMVLIHRDKYARDSKVGGKLIREVYQVEETKRALSYMISESAHEHRLTLRQTLQFCPTGGFDDYADGYLRAVVAGFKVDSELQEVCTLALKQWLWQVKAYLYNKPVTDPLFLNIQSLNQGCGKSYFVNKLCAPITDYMDPGARLDYATDDRESERFTTNYVLFFDELVVGASGQEYARIIAAFKQVLTAQVLTSRVLYTTKQMKMPRIYSGISTSNPSMVDTIYDDTGMRRFFEIPVQADTQGNPVELITKMESLAIWRGIDENLPQGYLPAKSPGFQKLREIQDSYKKADLLDMYLEHAEMAFPPIYQNSSDAKKYVDAVKGAKDSASVDELQKLSGFSLVTPHTFRREVIEWVKNEIDSHAGKYIKGVHVFHAALSAKGVALVKVRDTWRVLCQEGGTVSGLGI